MEEYDFSSNEKLHQFKPIHIDNTKTKLETITLVDNQFKVNVDGEFIYQYDKELDLFNLNTNSEQIVNSSTGTTVKYEIYKNNERNPVKENTYFKAGDTIKVETTFNKYLTSSWGSSNSLITAPTLTLYESDNRKIEIENGTVTGPSNSSTKITYEYTVKDGDNLDITQISLSKTGTIYAMTTSQENSPKSFTNLSVKIYVTGLHIDTIAPSIQTNAYVENALETGRYTAGKEILINVTTSEAIQGNYVAPALKVNFSKSGAGKYNYTKEPETVGYAKCKEARINVDGSTTWIYSYQIQEGDEGDVQLAYTAGSITDLAGNITDLTKYSQHIGGNVSGEEINLTSDLKGNNVASNVSESKSVHYYLYKGKGSSKTPITGTTYIKNTDTLTIEVKMPGFIYTVYDNGTSGNSATLLTKQTAPTLLVDNKEATAIDVSYNKTIASNIKQQEYEDAITTITYEITGNTFDYANITKLNSVKIQPKQDIYLSNRYVKEFADGGEGTDELYDINQFNRVVTKIQTTTSSSVSISDFNIFVDPIGIAETFSTEGLYADTTAPTVEIVTQKLSEETTIDIENNITNADKIRYTFTWSEELAKEEGRTFEEKDIIIQNGTKVENSFKGPNKNEDGTDEYTIDVIPSIASGNVGEIQLTIEKGACMDLVAHENVKSDSVITIDKQAPTVEIQANKEYVQVGEPITYTFTWSEAVKDFDETKITVNNAEKVTEGYDEDEKVKFTKINDAQYTLEVMPTNGNDVEIIIDTNACTDLAGNANVANKHIIEVIPTVKITTNTTNPTKESTIEYTFTWSEKIVDFTAEDIIVPEKAIKGELIAKEEEENTYTITVDYSRMIPNGNEGEVTIAVVEKAVRDTNGNENAYTTNTTKIDRIAPILISLEAYADSNIEVDSNIDTVKQYFKTGDIVTIVATFSENIENSDIPSLTLQFSQSGNAKGTITEGVIEGNKITYTYTITEGDVGELSVKGFSGRVVDVAGNETKVTKRALDGDTIIADTIAPKLIGITAIAPDFEYDEFVTGENSLEGETKRYGVQSKTRTENKIILIAEYSKNVYSLNEGHIEKITSSSAPVLNLRFGTGAQRTAVFDKVEENKIYYTYTIQAGDNGKLQITSFNNQISDIAGNTYKVNISSPAFEQYEDSILEENKVDNITADTTNALITISATAIDYDDNGNQIQGNGYYYRKGSIITVTAKTNEYIYQNNNKNLALFTVATAPKLNIRFASSGTGMGTCTEVAYQDKQTIFTYTYQIKDKDNGTLSLSMNASQGYDIALNGNNAKEQVVNTISADTVNPVTNWQSWIESEKYGIVDHQNGTWTVTFSETLYVYNTTTHRVGNVLSNSNKAYAPILLISKDNETVLETQIQDITTNSEGKTVITYSYSPYTKNMGAYGMKFASVSDRAGNLFNYKDQEIPVLSNIKVISPESGTYKAGQSITIVATFNEKVTGTAPVLTLKFGETAAKGAVSRGVIQDNTITYTYTITDGDNGKLAIESYTGTGLKDNSDNLWTAPEHTTLSGNQIIADTIAPTLVITSDVEKTNHQTVTYTFTWSEPVEEFTMEDVEVTNGLKGKWTKKSANVYTLEVDTTEEGRQTIKVNAEVCTDIVGNPNEERTTYNQVVIDDTKPVIRAKVNGGNYVIDTDTQKSTLKETIVVNEEVSTFKYIWSTAEILPTEGFQIINPDDIQVNSDIKLETQVEEEGTYYLYIIVIDQAGNELVAKTNGFVVMNSVITLTPNTTENTKEDITVKVTYGAGLTENKKAGIQGKTQSADATTVIVSENGTVYAEATDTAGNKVYVTLPINNIQKDDSSEKEPVTPPIEEDKTAPEITFNYTTTTATVGTTIGATITTNEDAIIQYSWDNQNWSSSNDYVRNQKVIKTPLTAGTYTLYAKATDRASNQSTVQKLVFTVVESEDDIAKAEVVFEDLTTIQKDGVKYVKVSPTYTTSMLTSKMNKEALLGKTPKYTNLTSDQHLKTGSEITIDGNVKYIVIVNGDVNCDGKVEFLTDIVMINNYRIGINKNLSDIQILAGDINNSGTIEFIPDIVAMNNYRMGRINVL